MFAVLKCDSAFQVTPCFNFPQTLATHLGQPLFGWRNKIKTENKVYILTAARLFQNNFIFS